MLAFEQLTGPRASACYAALGLVVIQVGMGIVLKSSQTTEGHYGFSPSASITISEFLKFLLSTAFFWYECREPRLKAGPLCDHFSLPSSARSSIEQNEPREDGESICSVISTDYHVENRSQTFGRYCINEVTSEARYGFAQLALLYSAINNTVRSRVVSR
jgi:hypothetical protein